MDGILNILKPPGMTSFDVVGYLRRIVKTTRIGHTGTLDPGAVGVLTVCVGRATKAIEYMVEKDKVYRTEITLGIETDTQDNQGQIINKRPVNVQKDTICEVIRSFVGKQQQTPPMYSAVKVNGKKLYELARSGITVEREPRNIEIYFIDIVKVFDDNRVLFDVGCSKGTYIRTLCSDIGDKLGCGAHMSFLVRTKAGSFDISNSLTMEEVAEYASNITLNDHFTGVEEVFKDLKLVELTEDNEKKFLNGCTVEIAAQGLKNGDKVRVFDLTKRFIALGNVLVKDGNAFLKSKKLF